MAAHRTRAESSCVSPCGREHVSSNIQSVEQCGWNETAVAYDKHFARIPPIRLWFERDQLWKRLGETLEKRLRELEKHLDLIRQRDGLNVKLCAAMSVGPRRCGWRDSSWL
jgi:hypothetical protein